MHLKLSSSEVGNCLGKAQNEPRSRIQPGDSSISHHSCRDRAASLGNFPTGDGQVPAPDQPKSPGNKPRQKTIPCEKKYRPSRPQDAREAGLVQPKYLPTIFTPTSVATHFSPLNFTAPSLSRFAKCSPNFSGGNPFSLWPGSLSVLANPHNLNIHFSRRQDPEDLLLRQLLPRRKVHSTCMSRPRLRPMIPSSHKPKSHHTPSREQSRQ